MGFWNKLFGKQKALPPGDISVSSTEDLRRQLPPTLLKNLNMSAILPAMANNKPQFKDWSTKNAIKEGYKASVWVFACIYRIAKAAASVDWAVEQKTAKGWRKVTDHPLAELIQNPNPLWSRQDYIERLTMHLYLGGNAIQTKVRANGKPKELWLISPDVVYPIPIKSQAYPLAGYEVRSEDGRVVQILEPKDVCHQQFTDPANPYWGMAPLQACGRAVDTDREASNWNKNALENRAVASGAFVMSYPLTQEQFEESVQMVKAQYQGPSNAWAPWVLGNDAKWQQMSLAPIDMDFFNGRKFSRDEILSCFNVPPPIVGVFDKATLANIQVSRLIFWLDTVIPFLDDIKQTWNRSLVPEFGKGLRITYDLSHVPALREQFKEHVEIAQRLHNMGVPFNVINNRLDLGFEDIQGGDIGYMAVNKMPVDAISSLELGNDEE